MRNFNSKNLPIIYGVLLLISLVIMFCLWNVVSKVVGYLIGNPILWGVYIVGIIMFISLHKKFPTTFTLKEMGLSIVATFPAFFVLFAIFFSTTTDLSDTEYLNYNIQKVVHIADYYTDREVCDKCKDDKGNEYDCNCRMVCDVYHPDSYYMIKTNGESQSISSGEYNNIRRKFGTKETLVESSQFDQCSGDGRKWEVVWNGTWETMIPTSQTHLYINYVKATSTLHKLTGQTGNKDHILSYPNLKNYGYGSIDIDRVLTAGVTLPQHIKDSIDIMTDKHLSTLGKQKQCNILYYFVNETQSYYGLIEQEWIRGKKNDITVIIGMKTWPKIEWVRIMCWSKQSIFQVQLRDQILDMKSIPSANTLVSTVVNQVKKESNAGGFERQPMEEYKYLLREVNLGWVSWVVVILILSMMMAPLVIYFFSTEDFE